MSSVQESNTQVGDCSGLLSIAAIRYSNQKQPEEKDLFDLYFLVTTNLKKSQKHHPERNAGLLACSLAHA